jgi:hypothetical protein
MTKKLRAPKGTDEANADGKSFRVDNNGIVEVPDEAAAPLIERGGFTEVVEPPAVPVGHALVMHSDPGAACEGEKFGDGYLVPVDRVAELASHGFMPAEHTPSPFLDPKTGPTIAQWVAAGYKAANYPPSGYASKSTQEEIDAAIAAEAAAGAKK